MTRCASRGVVMVVIAAGARAAHADPAPAPLATSVLVWNDAPLFIEPSASAPSVTVGSFHGDARDAHFGEVMAMRVVSTAGELVEVTPSIYAPCTSFSLATGDIGDAHVFVRRGDLATVLARDASATFADGTRVALAAGTPIAPMVHTTGRYVVAIGPDSLAVDLADAAIATSYPSPAGASAHDHPWKFGLAPGARVTAGSSAIVIAADADYGGAEPWRANAVERRGATTLFTTTRGCAKITVEAPSAAVVAYRTDPDSAFAHILTGDGNVDGSPARFVIAEATPVTTASGRTLGKTRSEVEVAKPTGKLACFDATFELDADTHVHASAPPATTPKVHACAPASRVHWLAPVAAKQPSPSDPSSRRPLSTLGEMVGDPPPKSKQ